MSPIISQAGVETGLVESRWGVTCGPKGEVCSFSFLLWFSDLVWDGDALLREHCGGESALLNRVPLREPALTLSWMGGLPHTSMCLRRCSAKWSDREKLRSQSAHLKGFTPVCLR